MSKRTGLEARMRDALSAGVIMCGLLSGCAVTPKAIRDLPELPAELNCLRNSHGILRLLAPPRCS